MDETDPNIKFDSNGLCNHCTNFYKIKQVWDNDVRNENKLFELSNKIKDENDGSDFDCILGISGGVEVPILLIILKKYLV